MAIWQYTCILIPSKNFDSNYIQFLKQKETGYLKETYFFWENCYLNIENISEKIDLNISESKSKNDDYVGWKGNSENLQDNDCSISLSGDFIKEHSLLSTNRSENMPTLKTIYVFIISPPKALCQPFNNYRLFIFILA